MLILGYRGLNSLLKSLKTKKFIREKPCSCECNREKKKEALTTV